MTPATCASPLPLATLLEYWLGELDETREGRIDEHLLGCGHCSASLQNLLEIAGGIRAAVRTGAVRAVLTGASLKRLAARGLRMREYRVPHNGSVNCTVAPDDDLLVAHLQAPLGGIERLDLEQSAGKAGSERQLNIPFDAATGEVVVVPRIDFIRTLPASTVLMRLLAVAPSGEHLVGEYTFHHTPWPAGDPMLD